jgi:hypothetical protein
MEGVSWNVYEPDSGRGQASVLRRAWKHWRGFKIAHDTRGPVIDPSTMERRISEEKLTAARA